MATAHISTQAMAQYIAEMTREMSAVARARGLIALADVLRIAHHEADVMSKTEALDIDDKDLAVSRGPGLPS